MPHIKTYPPDVLQQTIHWCRVLCIIHGKGEVVDVLWINPSIAPVLCMQILVKHVHIYHVYCHLLLSTFEQLDHNLMGMCSPIP